MSILEGRNRNLVGLPAHKAVVYLCTLLEEKVVLQIFVDFLTLTMQYIKIFILQLYYQGRITKQTTAE